MSRLAASWEPPAPAAGRRREQAPGCRLGTRNDSTGPNRASDQEGAPLSHLALLRLSFSAVNAAPLLSLPFMDDNLASLEPELRASVRSGDPFLDEVTGHLIAAGGKRLRPGLALAAATGGARPAGADDLQGAVAVELVHLASLYHDDVMDEATMRRTVESVNARWGNLVAIVAGDFLLARSAEIAASLGTEIAGLLAHTLGQLCQGQVAEVRAAFSTERTEDHYFTAITGKTAALMATSCRIGALTGGLPRDEVEALTTFGRCLGMLFQLRDDVLDVIGSEEELGKMPGQDLAEGIYTLPVLKALRDPGAGPELAPLLGKPLDQPERDKARSIVAGSGAIEATIAAGRRYVEEASDAAASLPGSDLGRSLTELAHGLLDDLPVGSR
jgi:heptaprenyl diphosphate synthase